MGWYNDKIKLNRNGPWGLSLQSNFDFDAHHRFGVDENVRFTILNDT
jgi:hypothetical protein